jgi:urea transport system permease protein
VTFPEYWLYFLGAMFIAVTLFLPQGIVGLVRKLKNANSKEAHHDARPSRRRCEAPRAYLASKPAC